MGAAITVLCKKYIPVAMSNRGPKVGDRPYTAFRSGLNESTDS